MYSIYHFFKTLIEHKDSFLKVAKLEAFPFDTSLLSCQNAGQFPDMAIKIDPGKSLFTGGELIELKDSISYSVSSFNSTIPTGKKEIEKVIKGEHGIIFEQMEAAGDDVYSLPLREVYYLIRGKKNGNTKVCLVHGSFFETVEPQDLIGQSFSQVLEERLSDKGIELDQEMRDLLVAMFSDQESFSKIRNVDKASVKLRFRVMTEVRAEGNILNGKKYPEIKDNSLNLLVPCHNDEDERLANKRMKTALGEDVFQSLAVFKLKHHFNGYFLVFQGNLK